jgi:ubiquinone/menaquinone biosynthesis C-methylase UbiE
MTYVHGYGAAEIQRLQDQATSLVELLHSDTAYPAGASVLEVGCGTGAQTVTLAARSPEARFTSVDHSTASLEVAEAAIAALGLRNVTFKQADIYDLPYTESSFDHVFVCFVLEHLDRPVDALKALRRLLKSDGVMTVIEGDHGSTYFHPHSALAHRTINCQVTLQAREGGDATIGRRLFPLLREAGFASPRVSPRMVYVRR